MRSGQQRRRRPLPFLRYARSLSTPLLFAMVGMSGACVDLASFALLQRMAPLALARGLAIWLAMTWNFALNRRVTFADARGERIGRQYLMFCAACGAGAAVNWSVTVALCAGSHMFAVRPAAAAIVGIGAGTVLKYFASRHIVFRSEPRLAEPIAGSIGDDVCEPFCEKDPELTIPPRHSSYARAA
jgi:putative flippase GtrA